MAQQDLTTLAKVKLYATSQIPDGPTPSTSDDPLISDLITVISQTVLANLSRRTILAAPRTDTFDGQGWTWKNQKWPLRYQPVISVQSVTINGSSVPPIQPGVSPGNPNNNGFTFDPYLPGEIPGRLQMLKLNGFSFTPNFAPNNCVVNYTAGYQNSENTIGQTSFTPASPYGLMLADAGVKYTLTGAPLRAVPGTPAVGQYVAPNPLAASSPTNNYTFNSGDDGNELTVSYSFCPSAIEIATRMWVVEMYRYRQRVGERSQSEGGIQTASYIVKDIPDFVALALSPFKVTNFMT